MDVLAHFIVYFHRNTHVLMIYRAVAVSCILVGKLLLLVCLDDFMCLFKLMCTVFSQQFMEYVKFDCHVNMNL